VAPAALASGPSTSTSAAQLALPGWPTGSLRAFFVVGGPSSPAGPSAVVRHAPPPLSNLRLPAAAQSPSRRSTSPGPTVFPREAENPSSSFMRTLKTAVERGKRRLALHRYCIWHRRSNAQWRPTSCYQSVTWKEPFWQLSGVKKYALCKDSHAASQWGNASVSGIK